MPDGPLAVIGRMLPSLTNASPRLSRALDNSAGAPEAPQRLSGNTRAMTSFTKLVICDALATQNFGLRPENVFRLYLLSPPQGYMDVAS
jgi:hypothetical protein